ncbi:hypothetical protein MUK42_21246 [Musa troglodytarum]|uniref:Uncharacterized protein n=1 Tax=Musa troglodytarum TaxID=320322 RepID=A0A9E7FY71_9LILI|nr:hypothetical protein MUK42_21246 [Musa troglodytarum]
MREELERASSSLRTKYLRIPTLPSSASSPQHRPLPLPRPPLPAEIDEWDRPTEILHSCLVHDRAPNSRSSRKSVVFHGFGTVRVLKRDLSRNLVVSAVDLPNLASCAEIFAFCDALREK